MGQEDERSRGYMAIQMDELLQMPNTFIILLECATLRTVQSREDRVCAPDNTKTCP